MSLISLFYYNYFYSTTLLSRYQGQKFKYHPIIDNMNDLSYRYR